MRNKDRLFMNIAKEMQTQSTCLRRWVGAVLVRDNIILSTGYNGTPSKLNHCKDHGCLRQKLKIPSGSKSELCRGVHAEINAIIQCAIKHTNPQNSVLYCTTHPCIWCVKTLINAGVKEVVYLEEYDDDLAKEMLKEAGIKVRKYSDE